MRAIQIIIHFTVLPYRFCGGMKIGWFSFGVSSFIACYIERETIDRYVAICLPEDQHEDSMRFLHDCEKVLGKKIELIRSDKYQSLDQVIEKRRCMNTVHGAPCCTLLKKEVRTAYEKLHPGRHVYVWGYDVTERKRAERLFQTIPEHDHVFPLIEHNLTKEDCHGILERVDFLPRRPSVYDLGFPNNNCLGCVKQGKSSWMLTKEHFPDIFWKRAKQEREIGNSCLNGVFLDELHLEDPVDLSVRPQTQRTFFETLLFL